MSLLPDPNSANNRAENSISTKISISEKEKSVLQQILEFRTPYEKSELPCIKNIFYSLVKSFCLGYGIRAALSLVFTLFKFKKLLKDPKLLLKALFNENNFRMGFFTSLNTALLKSTITILRILTKSDDKRLHALAGFLAGYLSAFVWPNKTRAIWGIFALARAFDCVYNYLVIKNIIERKGWHYGLIFVIVQTPGAYAFGYEPYLAPPSLEKFYLQVTNMHNDDKRFRFLWHEITRRKMIESNIVSEPFIGKAV